MLSTSALEKNSFKIAPGTSANINCRIKTCLLYLLALYNVVLNLIRVLNFYNPM